VEFSLNQRLFKEFGGGLINHGTYEIGELVIKSFFLSTGTERNDHMIHI
jgi:hypothetical protein